MIIQCPNCQSRYDTNMRTNDDAIRCRCGVKLEIPDLPNLARSWKCPNCSGNVDPTQSRCDYCDAYIAFARCPACFSIAPYDEAKHCAECGELLTLPIEPIKYNKSQLPCPRCTSALKSRVINDSLIDHCLDCGGVWLSHHLLDDLLKTQDVNSTAALGKLPEKTAINALKNEVHYLPCPECSTMMHRRNFMKTSGIILDECHSHGVWFDKYELAVALEFTRSTKTKPTEKQNQLQKTPITRRDETEVFEIKDEDLSLLLEEFPHWLKVE